ncbi:uncharacterized protein [Haliotis asinina]|uniref:uncharacterized protein n=1 Tax=Haliotis asinina TaxID=109174 RepID=UPI003531E664
MAVFNRQYLAEPPHFWMTSLEQIRDKLSPGAWLASLNLQDAYLHVPIHPHHRKYLRFVFNGIHYQWRVLPFGISTALWLFTRITLPVTRFLHLRGVDFDPYIDDCLLNHGSPLLLRKQLDFSTRLLHQLGWMVNTNKSHLEPTQELTFIGGLFLTKDNLVMVPPDARPQVTGSSTSTSTSVSPVVDGRIECLRRRLFGRLQSRPRVVRGCVPARVGRPSGRPDDLRALELQTVILAVHHWLPILSNTKLLVVSDNSTVVWVILNQGTTRSKQLLDQMFVLADLLDSNGITVRVRHIPGCKNILADALSRPGRPSPTEWMLHPDVFRQICLRHGRPLVDLFATSFNHQLPTYVSPVPDPQAWAVDALSLSWEGLDAYAFPPDPSMMTSGAHLKAFVLRDHRIP